MPVSRFDDAGKYESYLKSPAGRLRSELAWETLREFLPADAAGLRALDVGGGSGATSIRLARMGFEVALVDSAEPMLDVARRHADAANVAASISFVHADAARLTHLFHAQSFDVVVCHNLVEYVDDAAGLVCELARLLRRGGVLSILARNRFGEVLKAAITCADLEQALRNLTADTVIESLYGGTLRVFAPEDLRAMVARANLDLVAERGVRVVSDYVGGDDLTDEAFRQLLDLEMTLGTRRELAAVARYTQLVAKARNDGER